MTLHADARGARFLEGLERVVVAGLGRSGRAAAGLLARHGLPVTVVEARSEAEIAADLAALPTATRHVPESDAADVLRRVRDEAQAAGRLGDVLRGALETRT